MSRSDREPSRYDGFESPRAAHLLGDLDDMMERGVRFILIEDCPLDPIMHRAARIYARGYGISYVRSREDAAKGRVKLTRA